MDTICKALKAYCKSLGISPRSIPESADTAEIISELAGYERFKTAVTPSSPAGTKEYWGTKVSDMQTSITVANGAITGTLKKLTSGQLVTDWGEGYFLALKFAWSDDSITDIKVGLDPSVSSGLVSLDSDKDGVFKITDKDTQVFMLKITDGEVVYTQTYDLSGLTLSDS